jgi:hypothetical protein
MKTKTSSAPTLPGIALLLAAASLCFADALRRDAYTIEYPQGSLADAEQIDRFTSNAIGHLAKAFPDWDAESTFKRSKLRIIIHDARHQRANENMATLVSSWDGGRYAAELHLFAPSKHPPSARTNVGEPKDAIYFQRLLIHELSTILLDQATRAKPSGWKFHAAPNWFVQGLEQYVSYRQTGAAKSLQLYIDRVRRDPNIIQTEFGLQVTDPYIGGTVLLAFMDERYGWQNVQQILLSREPTFSTAIRNQLGITSDAFIISFREWLSSK